MKDTNSISANEQMTFDRAWPVHNLQESSFERFCTDFLALLFMNANVNRYGDRGHKQHGLDIEISFPDGSLHTAQCKRVSSFEPSRIRQAVADHTKKAERKILLLSCIATPNARDEIKKFDEWELWDREDISRIIRHRLAKTQQIQLVDTYFPGKRFELTGELEPSPWRTPEEYFTGMVDNPHGFSQAWNLVGRSSELTELVAFCAGEKPVLFLTANAGMGKTRLLKALADSLPSKNSRIYFVAREPITSKSLEGLGNGPKILICDDSHEREDIALLFDYAAVPEHQTHLIVSFRRYAWAHVVNQAHGYLISDIPEINLKNLAQEHTENLAAQALEAYEGNPGLAKQLATVTADFPLATVMGAQVLANSPTYPDFLLNKEKFHTEIMKSVIGGIASHLEKYVKIQELNNFLGILALLQPFTENSNIYEIIETLHPHIKAHRSRVIISHLLEVGVLFKNGPRYRIAPDLFADFIIEQNCIGPEGGSTGFAESIFRVLKDYYSEHLLVNLGRLDWRKSAGDTRHSRLLDSLWAEIKWQDVYSNPHMVAVASVAYYQPAQTLAFVKRMVADGQSGDQLVKILTNIAYNYEYLPEACPLLWELGIRDSRQNAKSFQSNGIKALENLAKPDLNKPSVYVEKIIDFAISLLPYDVNWTEATTPLDLLKEGLATEGTSHSRSGKNTMTMTRFMLSPWEVKSIREKTISSLINLLTHDDIAKGYRAATLFQDALRYPMVNIQGEQAEKYYKEWEENFVTTLKRLYSLVETRALHPVVLAALGNSVLHKSRYGKDRLKTISNKIINNINSSLHTKVVAALINGWSVVWGERDYEQAQKSYNEEIDSVVKNLFEQYVQEELLLGYMKRCLDDLLRAKIPNDKCSPDMLLGKAIEYSDKFAWLILQDSYNDSKSLVYRFSGNALAALLKKNYPKAKELRNEICQSGQPDALCILASAYSQFSPCSYSAEDVSALKGILSSKLPNIGKYAPRVWANYLAREIDAAIDVLKIAEICLTPSISHDYFMYLCGSDNKILDKLSESDVAVILNKIMTIKEINDYHLARFFAYSIHKFTGITVNYFEKRIEEALLGDDPYFRIIDLDLEHKESLKLFESPDYERWLRHILCWASSFSSHDYFKHMFGKLLNILFYPFPASVIEVFKAWICNASYKEFLVMKNILHALPENFVFEHEDFVHDFLQKAQAYGRAEAESTKHEFLYGVERSGWTARGDQKELGRIEHAREVLSRLECFSPSYALYGDIIASAERTIAKRRELEDEDF